MNAPKELQLKYRPTLFKHVIGQPEAVATLQQMLKDGRVPHALLFTGPSGCSKTTLARILRVKLECGDGDFQEINAANFRGIDTVREIQARMSLMPIHGKCRVVLIDECHKLSNDAQTALLKSVEEPPAHFYFMLATTDPQKLIKTLHNRCTEIRIKELDIPEMTTLLEQIAEKEKMDVHEEAMEKIIEAAQGSARAGLVLLNKLVGMPKEDHVDLVEKGISNPEAIKLARLLFNKGSWKEIADTLRKVTKEDVESYRWCVLGYAKAILLSGRNAETAFLVISCFEKPFYDSGVAGLCAAAYDAATAKR